MRRRPTGWPRTRRRSSTPRRAQARRCATAVLFVATGAPKAGALSLKGKSLLKVLSMADFFQRQRHGCQRATQTTHARGPTRAARSRSATQAAARPAASRACAPPRAAPLAWQASRAQPHFPYSPRLASGTRGRAHAGRRADATRGATARGRLRGRRIVEAVQAASWCSVCVHVPPDTSFVPWADSETATGAPSHSSSEPLPRSICPPHSPRRVHRCVPSQLPSPLPRPLAASATRCIFAVAERSVCGQATSSPKRPFLPLRARPQPAAQLQSRASNDLGSSLTD